MVVFVFGGLLVLQRSDVLDLPKLMYLVAAAVVGASSVLVLWRTSDTQDQAVLRPWIAISVAFAFMIAVSLPVALVHGVGLTPWLRTAAGYGLFAMAPLVAFDARRVVSGREAVGWTLLAGALAAISFSIHWLERRQIADLGIDPLVLPSAQLAYAAFAVAVAFAFQSRRVVPWAVVGGLILGALLITGARTTILLFAVPAILAVIAGRSRWRQTGTALSVGAATTALVFVMTIAALSRPSPPPGPTTPPPSPAAASPAGTKPAMSPTATSARPTSISSPAPAIARPDLIGQRIGSIGTMFVDAASGQSLRERIAQTQAAFVVFAANPLLGSGPGTVYAWTNSSGVGVESYILDTPLMVAAEFGLMGVAVVLGLVAVFVWFIRLIGGTRGRSPERLCVIGLATTFGLTSLLGPPMDDKGAAYALALVLTIGLSVATGRTADAQRRTTPL